jgi:hypothetical protein
MFSLPNQMTPQNILQWRWVKHGDDRIRTNMKFGCMHLESE